ncbi:hypothetical protein [Ramlibacter sp.]|uniref:hypothetical protein n=1 Tax=Ramlibacter sp. TaxID=1917967 RepID=UPI0035AF7E4E
MRKRFGWSAWLLAAALLGACGGGGDEGLRAVKAASPLAGPVATDPQALRKAATPIAGDFMVNGGFEQGEAGWSGVSSAGYALTGGFNAPPAPPNTGSRMAWLGGDNRLRDQLSQTITGTKGPHRIYLEFWYQVLTEEKSEDTAYDVLEVLAFAGDTTSGVVTTLSNVNRTKGWTRAGPFDISYYRGYTGPLRFQSTTDETLPTSFLIDDVSVYTVPEVGLAPESGMWWNPAEPGRGFFIDYRNDQVLLGAYMFEPSEWATWYSGQLTRVGPIFNEFGGELQRHQGGQSLAGAWRPPTASAATRWFGARFGTPTRGMLEGRAADGAPIAIGIERFSVTGGPIQPSAARFQNGMWWSEAESGRGYVVDVQGSTVLFGAFMYNEAGQPVWYVASAPLTSPDSFVVALQQMRSGQTLGGGWREAIALPDRIGSIRFEASSATAATLTLPNGRSVAIRRVAS